MFEEQMKNSDDVLSAVFFAENIQDPEYLLNSILFQLSDKYPKLKNGLLLFTYELKEPWSEKKQSLKVCYQVTLSYHNRCFDVVSFTVEAVESLNLSLVSNKNQKEIFKNEILNLITITVNTDFSFFKSIEKIYLKKENQKASFKLNELFIFEPVFIPKPWGQEIWYTGVEKRGISKMKSSYNSSLSLPLTWVLSALPNKLLGSIQSHKNLILVKILDPIHEEVLGDLYYELHTEKNEVYVVTEVSSSVGKIKFGANPQKLTELSNNLEEFKKQFLLTIKQYEKIRRKIDSLFDKMRVENNISLQDPIPVNKIKEWSAKLPSELLLEEKNKKVEMDSFSGYLDLNIGDVVRVPILVPHALQHGVKVIEFQTPTYERLIISFAQKVLTQNHWDTDKAFEIMKILPPQKTKLEILNENENYCEELVCSFAEFDSSRYKMKANKKITVEAQDFYRILFNVSGILCVSSDLNKFIEVLHGTCILLPAGNSYQFHAQSDVTFLLCLPK